MRINTIVLTAVAIALAPMAQAQDYCGALKEVVAQATSGFEALKEDENFEDNYEPFFYLQDAYSCWIDTEAGSIFACYWQFDAPAQASAKLDQLDAATKACLAGWTRTDLSGKTSAEDKAVARGFRMDGSSANPTVFVEAFTEPTKERGSPSVSLNVSVK